MTRDDLGVGRPAVRLNPPGQAPIESDIERGPCPFSDPAFASVRLTFASVEFTGLPDVSADDLDSAWRDLAGQDLPAASLCEVRDRAATILRRQGYLAAVQIPQQRIEAGGTVRMDVLAARLSELQVRGDAGKAERLIAGQLESLTEQTWFNTRDAERSLLLTRDLPGYDARLTLRSAERDPGELIGDVVVSYVPVELVIGTQNLGAKAAGREGAFAEVAFNGLLGMGDRTTASFYSTYDWDEQRIIRIAHELALDNDGLRLGGGLLFSHGEPSIAGGAFKSATFAGEAHLRAAIRRRQASSIYATGGLEVVRQSLDFGPTPLSKDRLSILFARLDMASTDPDSIAGRGGFGPGAPRWRSTFSLEVRKGLGIFGASNDCTPIARCQLPNVPISNVLADPTSLVIRAQGGIEFRPVHNVTLALEPLFQWSDGPLLTYEQASLGNYTLGRGLDPGVVVGDSAAGASVEFRLGSGVPKAGGGLALQPFVFMDYAKAWIEDDRLNPDPRDVVAAGLGLRGNWNNQVDFGLTFAVPLQKAGYQIKRSDPRLLFTVVARLLPWSDR